MTRGHDSKAIVAMAGGGYGDRPLAGRPFLTFC